MKKPLLVTSYVDADLDGTACSLAYAEFLNKTGTPAVAGIFGTPHEEAQFIAKNFNLELPRSLSDCREFEKVVLVDASDILGLGGNIPPEKVIEIYDHRKVNEAEKFPNAKVTIELVGAAATLIAEKFAKTDPAFVADSLKSKSVTLSHDREKVLHNRKAAPIEISVPASFPIAGIALSRESALWLYAAIISNTLNFQSSTTTGRDRAMARWLKERSGAPGDLARKMFSAKSDLTGSKLASRIIHDFAWFELANMRFGVGQIETVKADEVVLREKEIRGVMADLKRKFSLDFAHLQILDLENGCNIFIADKNAENILSAVLNITFKNGMARTDKLLMRKQVVPLIKAYAEREQSG